MQTYQNHKTVSRVNKPLGAGHPIVNEIQREMAVLPPFGTRSSARERVASGELEPLGVGATAFLGSTRKSVNPPPSSIDSSLAAYTLRKLGRWHLQAVTRSILKTKQMNGCCRSLIPDKTLAPGQAGKVKILKSKHDQFHYGGLMTCGSVWVCPVCSSKITERRKDELARGVSNWLSDGGGVQLLTLTVPHYACDRLQTVLDGLSDAFERMMNRKPWKRISSTFGLVGRIRTLEVTYGPNGWHPHFHVLLCTKSPMQAELFPSLVKSLLEQWQSACLSSNLPLPNQHGLTLVDGDKNIASYVSKWGIEHEMTKGHLKQGKKDGHVSPFGLLALHMEGDPKAAQLFRDYAIAFKGKRQLCYSIGLRDLLGLGKEMTDEELAASPEEDAKFFADIPLNVWKVILSQEKRGEVLEICKSGIDAFYDYIIEIMDS